MNPDGSGQTRLTDLSGIDFVPAVSADGTRVAFMHEDRLYVMNADGSCVKQITFAAVGDDNPSWSPDGKKLVYQSDPFGSQDVFVVNADGSGQRRLTTSRAADRDPAWSPDGTKIAFASTRDRANQSARGEPEIYVMDADGTNVSRLTRTPEDVVNGNPAWSPDGSRIAFDTNRDGNFDVYAMDSDGGGLTNLSNHAALDGFPSFSPDGTRIAFFSNRAQRDNYDIFAMNADGSHVTRLTSNFGEDSEPDWGRAPTRALRTCTVSGTQAADVLRGTPGADVLRGLGGNDRLIGLGGTDRLVGGPGRDVLSEGAGDDTLVARDGGVDLVDGGDGSDRARADRKDRVRSVERRY